MAFLVGYDTVASYVTFIVNEDRFPCYDGKGADYIPDPIISADAFNRSLRFSTRKPGFVDVDWGDGTKDQYPLVKVSDGSYRIVFRSLDIEYKKNPDAYKGSITDVCTIVRVAITGKKNSPDLATIMNVIGKDRTIGRLDKFLAAIGK